MERIDLSPRVKDESLYKNISLVLGLILLIIGIKDRELVKLVLGVLFVFYYSFRKSIYLTDEGVLFTIKGFLYNKKDLIHKEDIQEVLVVRQGVKSVLYFVMEPTAKKLVVDSEKLDDIIKFMKNRLKLPVIIER